MSDFYDILGRLSEMASKYDGFFDVGSGSTLKSWLDSVLDEFRISATGRIGYQDKSELDVDLSPDDGTLVEVTNDPIESNNGLYRKDGGAGSGSWIKASYDPYQAVLQKMNNGFDQSYSKISASNLVRNDNQVSKKIPWGLGYIYVVVDEEGFILKGITESLEEYSYINPNSNIKYIPWDPDSEFSSLLLDEDDVVLGHFTENAEFVANQYPIKIPYEDELSHSVYSEDNVLLYGFDDDGALLSPAKMLWPLPFIEDNTIKFVGDSTGVAGQGGDYPLLNPRAVSKDTFQAAWLYPSLTQYQRVRSKDGIQYLVPDDSKTLHIIITYGQSLSVGSHGTDLISTHAPYDGDALMFSGDETIDIRMGLKTLSSEFETLDPTTLTGFQNLISMHGQGAGSRGETVAESFGHGLSKISRIVGAKWRGLFFCAGLGGTAYSGLKKGTGPYSNLIAALNRAKELAAVEGWRVVVDAVAFVHGEADSSNPNYFNNILELQGDLDSDIKTITNQKADVQLLMSQPSSFYNPTAVQAMYEAHKSSNNHVLVAPNYNLEYSYDLLHLTGKGYYTLGHYFLSAYLKTFWTGKSWSPVMPEHISRQGRFITIDYITPFDDDIEIDTSSISNPGNFGFQLSNPVDGEMAIVSVQKTAKRQIVIELESDPSVTGSTLRYGLNCHVGDRVDENIPRGNIRDSNSQKTENNDIQLFNWCVHFEENVL